MKIEEFVNVYSAQYMTTFHKTEQEVAPEKSAITKISEFLFTPRYEVNNLKFKLVS